MALLSGNGGALDLEATAATDREIGRGKRDVVKHEGILDKMVRDRVQPRPARHSAGLVPVAQP